MSNAVLCSLFFLFSFSEIHDERITAKKANLSLLLFAALEKKRPLFIYFHLMQVKPLSLVHLDRYAYVQSRQSVGMAIHLWWLFLTFISSLSDGVEWTTTYSPTLPQYHQGRFLSWRKTILHKLAVVAEDHSRSLTFMPPSTPWPLVRLPLRKTKSLRSFREPELLPNLSGKGRTLSSSLAGHRMQVYRHTYLISLRNILRELECAMLVRKGLSNANFVLYPLLILTYFSSKS